MLAEADYNLTNQAFGGPQDPGDRSLYIKFYTRPWEKKARSLEEGRPIFEDTEFIQIVQPGNPGAVIDRPIDAQDRSRFAAQYAHYKIQGSDVQIGTPLEQWPAITRSQVEELKFFKCYTVEQLALASDGNMQNFMGIQQLRLRAQAWLATVKDSAAAEKLAAELGERDSEIQILKEQVAALIASNDQAKARK